MKPSEFLQMCENESLRLSEEFSDDGYELSLWFGVNGLKMGSNGKTKWVKRKPPEKSKNFGISMSESVEAVEALFNVNLYADNMTKFTKKGSVKWKEDLLAVQMDAKETDVWHVISNGKNYVFCGNKWEELDVSDYGLF